MKEIEIIKEDIKINIQERDLLFLIEDMISFIASYGLKENLVNALDKDYDIRMENE